METLDEFLSTGWREFNGKLLREVSLGAYLDVLVVVKQREGPERWSFRLSLIDEHLDDHPDSELRDHVLDFCRCHIMMGFQSESAIKKAAYFHLSAQFNLLRRPGH